MSNTVKTKRTLRRAWIGGLAAIGGTTLLLTTLPAFAADNDDAAIQAACEIEILPGEAETGEGHISDIDPTGTHIAGYIYKERLYEAAVWVDGEPIALLDEEHSESEAVAINSHGLAVGYAFFKDLEGSQPFAYVDGEIVDLAKPEGYSRTIPTDINDDGTIVGYATNPDNDDHPFLWESYDAEPTPLPMPEDAFHAQALSISEDGRVAGDFAVDSRADMTGYVWDTIDGSAAALEFDGRVGLDAIEGDWIVGDAPNEESYNTGVRWHGVDATAERVDFHYVDDVNAQGDLVGNYGSGALTQRAAKYTADNKLYMLPFPGAATESHATTVSADGLIIGGTIATEEFETPKLPTLWHCEE